MSDLALTRDFNETVRARLARDDAFARALLDEAATLFPASGSPSPEEQEARVRALCAAPIEGGAIRSIRAVRFRRVPERETARI